MLGFLQQVGEQTGAWFYLVAAGVVFAEAGVMAGFVVPGETALIVAGFAARQGWIALWPMIGIAIAAAVLGDSAGYEIGRRFGPALRASRWGRLVGDRRWYRADALLHRYGGRAVLLGRFTAGLRALVPGMAGMARMRYLHTFLPWNIAGAVAWGTACVLLGYGLADSLATASRLLTVGPLALVAVAAVALVLVRLRKRHMTHR
ncbi:DedA family protein [Kribbella swartbergensis]